MIHGFTHVSLSVFDLDRSLAFYRDRLGLRVLADTFDGGAFDGREAMLLAGRTALCLQEHKANRGDRFDPTRTGLDHLSFGVSSPEELAAWGARLSAEGVDHSGVKALPGFGQFIELRDPDGIQLELHCVDAPAGSRRSIVEDRDPDGPRTS
jgi:glyoxylase I family protein